MKKIAAIVLTLMLIISAASAQTVGLVDFTTTDMEGNTVTQDIFADYDLTMVYVWSTWCGYCIEEIPAFADLKKALPENANIITICTDADMDPELELTRKILSASNANFQTLLPTEDMYTQLLGYAYASPTTFFVDSQGVPIVQPLFGVPSLDDPAGAYLTIINALLDLMEA